MGGRGGGAGAGPRVSGGAGAGLAESQCGPRGIARVCGCLQLHGSSPAWTYSGPGQLRSVRQCVVSVTVPRGCIAGTQGSLE